MGLALDLDAALQGLADRLLLHPGEEGLDDADLDVGLEQAEPDLSQGGVDVALGELGEPGEPISSLAEAFGERFEHGAPSVSTTAVPEGDVASNRYSTGLGGGPIWMRSPMARAR